MRYGLTPEADALVQLGAVGSLWGRYWSPGVTEANPRRVDRHFNGLASKAIEQGWTIEITRGDHLKWTPPDDSIGFVTTPSTPSDRRSVLNARSQLRRHGLKC